MELVERTVLAVLTEPEVRTDPHHPHPLAATSILRCRNLAVWVDWEPIWASLRSVHPELELWEVMEYQRRRMVWLSKKCRLT